MFILRATMMSFHLKQFTCHTEYANFTGFLILCKLNNVYSPEYNQ
jgi:hypothetical protein